MGDSESSPLTTSEIAQSNFRHFVFDILWFGLAVPSTARFLSVYAIRIGASPMLLGWLAALPAIIALASSTFSMWWRKKFSDTVQAQFWPGLNYRLAFLLPALTPFFPREWQPAWLILAVSIPAIPQGVSSVMFLVLLREGVANSDLTTLLSRRSLIFNVSVALSTLAFGFWLEKMPFPGNYQVMFVAAFVLSLISLLHVNHVRVIFAEPKPSTAAPAVKPWRARSFQRVAFVAVIMHVSFFALVPIIPLLLVDKLGADEAFMSIYALAELSAAALVATLTNRIVANIGTHMTMAIGMIGTGLSAIVLAASPSLTMTLVAAALSGGSWTMAAISLFGFFSASTPADNVTRYSTVYNQVVSLSIFVGPMLGSQLASASIDLTTVILIGAALRLLAGSVIPYELVLGRVRRARRTIPAV